LHIECRYIRMWRLDVGFVLRDVAAALVKLFSDAHVALARIRAAKYL
jgi:hypothetical protein